MDKQFYINSPILKMPQHLIGRHLSNVDVYLKLDNMQPSGSFKDRGISNMVVEIMKEKKVEMLVSSSGGNAGHAVATVGQKLGIPVDVFVPVTTKSMMVEKLKRKGANVIIHGKTWSEADVLARQANENHAGSCYIPPFDDLRIWNGNSSIIDELAEQNIKPNKIVLSVGGGGLLRGIQIGILKHGWQDYTQVIAAETIGTASFAKGYACNKPEALDCIDSIATSLGALSVVPSCLNSGVITTPFTVTDRDAVIAIRRFADDYNMLVEPACGASLSYVYNEFPVGFIPPPPLPQLPSSSAICCDNNNSNNNTNVNMSNMTTSSKKDIVVIIVCGGSAVNIELMNQWCKDFEVNSYYN